MSAAPILAKASAAVADGGTLLLVGHDLTNIGTGAPGPTSPAVLYTPADIVPELPELEIERAEQVRRPVQLDDGSEVERDRRARARYASLSGGYSPVSSPFTISP